MDFLRGHRLRFDDALDAVLLREVEDVVAHLRGIVGAKDLGAAGLGVSRERLGEFVEVRCGVGLAFGDLGAHRLEVDAFVGLLRG